MESAAYTLYLLVLVVAPLLFGGVQVEAYTLLFLAILVASLLLLKRSIKRDIATGAYQVQVLQVSLHFLFVSLLIFLIVQIVPMPAWLLGIISPEAKVVGMKSFPALELAGASTQIADWLSIAPYRYPVRMSAIRWTCYSLFFFGLARTLHSRRRIDIAVCTILIIACLDSLYGLFQSFSGSHHVLWYQIGDQGDQGGVRGTYINRNHFAGFMELTLVLSTAYWIGLTRSSERKRRSDPDDMTSLRIRLAQYFSGNHRSGKRALIFLACLVQGTGLFFSGSRGGIISACGGMALMSLLLLSRRDYRRRGLVALSLLFLILAYAAHVGMGGVASHFERFDADFKLRQCWSQTTLKIFNDYRLTGVGIGNFSYTYPKYRTREDTSSLIEFAHDDWSQFLAEGGMTAFLLLLAGASYYLYKSFRLWRSRRDPFAVSLGLAPFCALTSISIHSISDFNLHIPANCLVLAAIMAIGYAALHQQKHGGTEKCLYHYHRLRLRFEGGLLVLLLLCLIGWTGWWTMRHFLAETHAAALTEAAVDQDPHGALDEIRNAIRYDEWNAEYRYKLAWALRRIREMELTDPAGAQIIPALEEAVRLNPFVPDYHLRLGWEYTYLWKDPDYHRKWLPKADESMSRAAYFTGDKDPWVHQDLGNYWTMRSKTINPALAAWGSAWTKACWHYRMALSLAAAEDTRARMREEIGKYVWNFYPDEAFTSRATRE